MKVYRLLIDSSKRQPDGHDYNFEWDISGLATARDLKGNTWMDAVECLDPIRYSEVSSSRRTPRISTNATSRFSGPKLQSKA